MEALILAAESGGPGDAGADRRHAALNHNQVRKFNPTQKDPHWGRRNSRGIIH
ncbi:hypothetical protein [Bradyrhizobium genosp. SA-4]|uniref:hypothetical protein n=1 Tax=Bradyrhizobium genosp. SA-4 TaxID=508869 RepID=UPI00041FAD4D|nr:hypothetical protein [Bradyrhizobium genosp. SA-4]